MFEADWNTQRAYAEKSFKPKLRRYSFANSVWFWLVAVLLVWPAAMFVLFFLTAYRPALPSEDFRWLGVDWSTTQAQPGQTGAADSAESGEPPAELAVIDPQVDEPASDTASAPPPEDFAAENAGSEEAEPQVEEAGSDTAAAPPPTEMSADTPADKAELGETDAGGVAPAPDPRAYMHNRISAMSLREYLGRTVGAIPPACAITQGSLPRPIGPRTPGQPKILDLFEFDQGEATDTYTACLWRDDPFRSLLAAWSLDVGVVQKVTLLLLIIAMFILIRNKRFRAIEQEAWPVNDRFRGNNKPGWRLKTVQVPVLDEGGHVKVDKQGDEILTQQEIVERMPQVAHHPIRYTIRRHVQYKTGTDIPEKMLTQTFYPTEDLPLGPMTDEGSPVVKYDQGLTEVVGEFYDAVPDDSLRGPVDLIKDVLRAGAHSGRVGDAERRMRVAAYEYTTSLSDRLDTAYYLMWLLPTVGFLGTIYGISASLVRAKGLFGGEATLDPNEFSRNIQLVVDGLGVAFDTTSMALVCSAFLYWRLVRAEQDIRLLSARARDSLSNLLVDRLVDRVDKYSPNGLATEPSAPAEFGKRLEVPISAAAAPADPDTREPDV